MYYRKVPKFLNARKLCHTLPNIQTKSPNLRVFCQKDADGIANSEDSRSSLNWVCTVCPDLSVRKLRIITVLNLLNVLRKKFDEMLCQASYQIFRNKFNNGKIKELS